MNSFSFVQQLTALFVDGLSQCIHIEYNRWHPRIITTAPSNFVYFFSFISFKQVFRNQFDIKQNILAIGTLVQQTAGLRCTCYNIC
jgi:hypothetical protein